MRLHGKRHKRDRYYFRWHYGKQRRVYMYKEYVDKPTEKQVSAREAFTVLRREVARQLRDAELRAAWMRRFEADNEGYKMLHTYVYAMMKRGESVAIQSATSREEPVVRLSRLCTGSSLLVVYNGGIMPIFFPWEVPRLDFSRHILLQMPAVLASSHQAICSM